MVRGASPGGGGARPVSRPAPPEPTASRMRALAAELVVLRQRLRLGGGSDRAEKQHAQGKLTVRERVALLLDDGEPWVEVGLLGGARPVRRPGARRRGGDGRRPHPRPRGGGGRQPRHREGRILVARNYPEDAPGPGDRHALPRADPLSGRLGRGEPPLPGGGVPGPVWSGAHLHITTRSCAAISACHNWPP